jgi:hypothetical protein
MESKSIHLKAFAEEGEPGPEHFDIITTTVDPAAIQDGDIVLKVLVISADPYQVCCHRCAPVVICWSKNLLVILIR